MKKAIIIGAGFAGLACAYHLFKKYPDLKLEIFDEKGIGGGASGIAAGLLHGFVGMHCRKSWKADEALEASLELLEAASPYAEQSLYAATKLYRPQVQLSQKKSFKQGLERYPKDLEALSQEEVKALFPHLDLPEGLIIQQAYRVHAKAYLEALAELLKERGVSFRFENFESEEEGTPVFYCVGGGIKSLKGDLPTYQVLKGQVLKYSCSKDKRLKMPLLAKGYALPLEDEEALWLGSTYEREFENEHSDQAFAEKDLMQRSGAYLPFLEGEKVLACESGLRVSCAEHLPFYRKIAEKRYLCTGLGSKGLLYHAFYAKMLANSLEKL